jgi:hypothetical protein
MHEDTTNIETERDFVVLLDRLAKQVRNTDWTQSTEDVSECLYGMIDYLDNTTDPTSPRDGLKWNEIGAMILEGLKKTKAYQTTLPDSG